MNKDDKNIPVLNSESNQISRKKWLIIDAILFVVLLVIDQITKYMAILYLYK